MHIVWVVGEFPRLTFIFRTLVGLARRGHQVTVMARGRGDWNAFRTMLPLPPTLTVRYTLPDTDLSNPRRLFDLVWRALGMIAHAPRKSWRFAKALRRVGGSFRQFLAYLAFVDLSPDVIHFDFPMTANQYRLLVKLLKVPTVVSCRGSDLHMLEQRDAAERALRIQALREATALHCVSGELAGEVCRLSGREQGVWVNRAAVPTDEIVPKERYMPSNSPLILAVGNLAWIKGFDYLLAALARLRREGCPFRAQIVGQGDLYAVLRFSLFDLDLVDQVELIPGLPPIEVLNRMRKADIFVLSSHQEGISNAALEAMASGLPIVTTAAGGMPEVVRDGVEGFVVPVRDIAGIADRTKRLLADANLREQMGRAARARIEAEFSLERQARVFEQIYQSIVPSKNAHSESGDS